MENDSNPLSAASIISRGIPIGNLTSQIFANLYLGGLDHFVKEILKCRYYIRYMDDLILFDNSKDQLNQWKEAIRKYLQSLKLELHARKCQIYLVRNGVPFLGYKIYPTHRLVLTDNIKRFRKRLKRYLKGSGGGGWQCIQRFNLPSRVGWVMPSMLIPIICGINFC